MVSSQGSLPLPCGNDTRSSVAFQIAWCRSLPAAPRPVLTEGVGPRRIRLSRGRHGRRAVSMSGTGTGNGCEVVGKVMRSRWLRRGFGVAGAAINPVVVRAPPCGSSPAPAARPLGRPIREERARLYAAPFRIVKFRSLQAPGLHADLHLRSYHSQRRCARPRWTVHPRQAGLPVPGTGAFCGVPGTLSPPHPRRNRL
jgi:hypothetical protein